MSKVGLSSISNPSSSYSQNTTQSQQSGGTSKGNKIHGTSSNASNGTCSHGPGDGFDSGASNPSGCSNLTGDCGGCGGGSSANNLIQQLASLMNLDPNLLQELIQSMEQSGQGASGVSSNPNALSSLQNSGGSGTQCADLIAELASLSGMDPNALASLIQQMTQGSAGQGSGA